MATLTSSFSEREYRGIDIAARTTSILSILGSMFIMGTFVCFPYFRKPINRLIFFATFGNIMVNIATLIATSALPQAGDVRASTMCEFQGILIQWFMSADAYWDFCMAINVLLVFFYGYDSDRLHAKEIWYFVFAYGVPGLPAIAYVILDHTGNPVIGTAAIWCWVNKENDWMRIAFFYAPVWLVIIATFTIYVVTGVHIFNKGALLRDFTKAATKQPDMGFSPIVAADDGNPFADLNNIVVTTEIGHAIDNEAAAVRPASSVGDEASVSSFSSIRNFSKPSRTMSKVPTPSLPATANAPKTYLEKGIEPRKAPAQNAGTERAGYRATISASVPRVQPPVVSPESLVTNQLAKSKNPESNEAAMAYLKVALLMFVAMIIIWVPSTINRLYSFVHQRQQPKFGPNLTSAIVLPLQGAWSATIYAYTTRSECRRAYAQVRNMMPGPKAQRRRDEAARLAERKRVGTTPGRDPRAAVIALEELDLWDV